MRRYYESNYVLFLAVADLALTCISLFLASQARLVLPWGTRLTEKMVQLPPLVYLAAIVIWGGVFVLLSVYDQRRTLRVVDEAQVVTLAVGLATLVFAGLLYLTFRDIPRLLFLYFVIANVALLLLLRVALRIGFRFAGSRQLQEVRVLIVGAGKVGRQVAQRMNELRWTGLTPVGFVDDDSAKWNMLIEDIPVLGRLVDAIRVVKELSIDEVVFALPLRAHRPLEDLVIALQTEPVRVRVVPDFFDLTIFRATIEDFGGMPLIGLRDPAIDGYNRLIKRAFDLALASCSFLLVSPLMLLIAAAIRVDSPGPALFRQQRVGENGRLFTMLKFRSMVVDAEKRRSEVVQTAGDGTVVHKQVNDPRVTRVGRFLRRTSLDELPQLFNVLRGDMSLVGPRPELPFLVERYEPWQRQRFAVPPGMTGWWQVNGRSERLMHLHTEDDLYYIRNYSPLLDLQILWRTVGVVVRGRGAY